MSLCGERSIFLQKGVSETYALYVPPNPSLKTVSIFVHPSLFEKKLIRLKTRETKLLKQYKAEM